MKLHRLLISIIVAAVLLSALPSSALEEITVTSCDVDGNEKNKFDIGDAVYMNATGLNCNEGYVVFIQPHQVSENDTIDIWNDPSSDGLELLYPNTSEYTPRINADGSIGPIMIWSEIPPSNQKTYDIVVDDGNLTYNSADDGLDSDGVGIGTGGFLAPVPELPTIILIAIGLIGLIALGRRR